MRNIFLPSDQHSQYAVETMVKLAIAMDVAVQLQVMVDSVDTMCILSQSFPAQDQVLATKPDF